MYLQPFDKHPADVGALRQIAAELLDRAAEALDYAEATRRAYQPAIDNWHGMGAAEMAVAGEPLQRAAEACHRALTWAAAVIEYWAGRVEGFNAQVDAITASLGGQAADDFGATGTGGEAPTLTQVAEARAAATAAARQQWALAYDTYIDTGRHEGAAMLRRGPNEQDLLELRDAGVLPGGGGLSPLLGLGVVGGGLVPPGTYLDLYGMSHASPARVNEWWNGLSPSVQQALAAGSPRVIGNLDGVPAGARDRANRAVLASLPDYQGRIGELQRLGGQRSDAQTAELERLQGVEAIRDRLQRTEPHQAYLLGFDPEGNGKAIVAVGNPDTADNVVTYVPGLGAGLRSVPTDLGRADLMVKEADKLESGSTSAVMWIGYEAPQDLVNAPGVGESDATDPAYAERAGPALDSFQHGLRATHEGAPSHNTVIGHSYGSTVVGHAAAGHALPVDDVVFVGSPGVGVDHAGDLKLDEGQVWSSHADNDVIRYGYDIGDVMAPHPTDPQVDLVHGRNPSDPDFGARAFSSEPGTPMVAVEPGPWYNPVFGGDVEFSPTDAHSEYWEEYSASLKNMRAIITDNDDLVK